MGVRTPQPRGGQEKKSTPPTEQHRSTITTDTSDGAAKTDHTTTPKNGCHEHKHKGEGVPQKLRYKELCPKLPRPPPVHLPTYCTSPTDAKAPLQLDHMKLALGTRCGIITKGLLPLSTPATPIYHIPICKLISHVWPLCATRNITNTITMSKKMILLICFSLPGAPRHKAMAS